MILRPLLFILLIDQFLSIRLLAQTKTLRQLSSEQSSQSTPYAKAIIFLAKSHPQLLGYLVMSVKTDLNRGDQSYANNLKDFHFELQSSTRKVIALVTVALNGKQQFVSISPFVVSIVTGKITNNIGSVWVSDTNPQNVGNSITNQTGTSTNYYNNLQNNILDSTVQTSQPIINPSTSSPRPVTNSPSASSPSLSSSSILQSSIQGGGVVGNIGIVIPNSVNLLGGFQAYSDISDPMVQTSKDIIASQHPNIVNYILKKASYQLVAGINIRLQYQGIDQLSRIDTILTFNMKNQPSIRSFDVRCLQSNMKLCDVRRIGQYFSAIDAMIVSHPQLLAYRIVEVTVQNIKSDTSVPLKINITFDNSTKKLKTLAELIVATSKITVQSFFTYSY